MSASIVRYTLLCAALLGACVGELRSQPDEIAVKTSALPQAPIEPPFEEDEDEDLPPEEPPELPGGGDSSGGGGGGVTTASCAIPWRANALAPVFYGFRDYGAAQGAPVPVRVFFPTLDGSPQSADILTNCGRYPVILFAHGQCLTDTNHHQRWLQLSAQLARSGYVVVVPSLPSMSSAPNPSHPALAAMDGVLSWLRNSWEHRLQLMPASATGVAGHSYGGLLAAEYARTHSVAGYVALGADWHSWSGSLPVFGIDEPKLVLWGGDEPFSQLSTAQWDALSIPKHRAVFTHGEHWDYLPASQSTCHPVAGSCTLIPAASADLITMFFAKRLPPELAPELPARIPDNLYPPALTLTPQQQLFASGHLYGMRAMAGQPGCEYALSAVTVTLRTVPDVRDLGSAGARTRILDAGLSPLFSGNGTWVYAQSPAAGAQVPANSTVTLTLRSGPRP